MFRPLLRKLLFSSTVLLLFQATAPAAFAENRVALVIGQSAYRSVVALPNPANDAKKMTELLGNAGFQVTAAPDLSQNALRQAVSNFAAKVAASGPDTFAGRCFAPRPVGRATEWRWPGRGRGSPIGSRPTRSSFPA